MNHAAAKQPVYVPRSLHDEAAYEKHMQTPLPRGGDHSKAWYAKAAKLADKAGFPGSAEMHRAHANGRDA